MQSKRNPLVGGLITRPRGETFGNRAGRKTSGKTSQEMNFIKTLIHPKILLSRQLLEFELN